MFVNQVAVSQYMSISYNRAWILKCLKTLSISLADDSAAATQPLSRSARVAGGATQPLCPEWLEQPLSHSAKVAGGATQSLCQSTQSG